MCWVRMPASSNRSLEKYGLTPKGTKFRFGIPETCGSWEPETSLVFWYTVGPQVAHLLFCMAHKLRIMFTF